MRRIFLMFVYLFSTAVIFAQIDTIHLCTLIITGRNLSVNSFFSDKIDSSFIQKNRSLQLSDLLKNEGSIYIKSIGNYGIATASFRGTAATHTQVFWNNVPLNSPMLGQTDFSTIPVSFTDKILITEGINTLAVTGGALGGAVNLASNFYSRPFYLNIFQKTASFSNYVTSFNLAQRFKKFSYNFRFQNTSAKNNFKYKNTALPGDITEELHNADFRQISFLEQSRYIFNSRLSVKQFLWLSKIYRNIPPIMTFEGLYRTENQNENKVIAGIDLILNTDKIKLKNTTALKFNSLSYFLADSVRNFPFNSMIIKSNSNSYEKTVFNLFKLDFVISQNIFSNIMLKTSYSDVSTFDSAYYALGGYAKNRLLNELNFTSLYNFAAYNWLIITISENVLNDKFYLPAFSVAYKSDPDINKKFSFSSVIGRNIHLPTLNDLYWLPGGNPDLKPEKSFSLDFSVKYQTHWSKFHFNFKNTFYASQINDWIIWKPTEFHYWKPENIKTVFSRGFSSKFMLSYRSKVKFKFITNYSFTKSTNISNYNVSDNSIGKQLIYIPVNLLNVSLYVDYKQYSCSVDFNYTDKRYTSTSNYGEFALPAYSLLNVSFARQFKIRKTDLNLTFRLKNLFNEQYQVVLYRPMPGRNFSFTIDFKL